MQTLSGAQKSTRYLQTRTGMSCEHHSFRKGLTIRMDCQDIYCTKERWQSLLDYRFPWLNKAYAEEYTPNEQLMTSSCDIPTISSSQNLTFLCNIIHLTWMNNPRIYVQLQHPLDFTDTANY